MSMEQDIDGSGDDRVLVGEYVLGLLDAPAHASVAARLAAEPELRREARLWRRRLSSLDVNFAESPAPATTFARIESRLFGTTQTALGGWWNSLALWRGLAGAALAVAVVAIGVNILRPVPIAPEAFATQLIAALEEEGSGVKFVALYDAGTGMVRLTALSGEPVPDKDFELWAIQGGNNPVSMGVIPIDARSTMPMAPDVLSGFGEGSVLAITLEQKGGSPDGAPHGPIVAKGAATLI